MSYQVPELFSGVTVACKANIYFDVPGNSFFEIEVTEGIAECVCSFL
jgi:uncharacterized protein YaiE (UPF0345 family)